MKWYIPREHGAWAMMIIPYWIGAAVSGVQLSHLIFFLGLFSIYFAQAPLLTFVRNPKHKDVWPSFIIYVVIGSALTIPYILSNIGLLWISLWIIPLFLINIYFAKTKRERWFINDLVAIIGLSSLMLLAYRLTEPALQMEIFHHFIIVILFFTSTVFHVKSLIREKKNKQFHKFSKGYHFGIIIVAIFANWFGAAVAFIVNLVKASLPRKIYTGPKKIGIIEIVNSTLFFVFVIGAYYL